MHLIIRKKKLLLLLLKTLNMIQRIQSVYLSFIVLISLLLIKGSILVFSEKTGSIIKLTFDGIFRHNVGQGFELIEKLLPLSLLIILIPIISLITIFTFKNRKIQLKLAIVLIILCTLLIIALIHGSIITISKLEASIVPGFKMFIPVAILILSILAYRGIKKDDQLVKSYDRLR
jgi:4-amino-4-deoxy-L-arabinose transferase-like glycosyltransferase